MIFAYLIHLLILICIYLILAISLQLSVGFTGLLNLGHIAFYCIGAYTSALLALNGFPFWICFLAAGILAMISGFLISFFTHKLKGYYFALAMIAFYFLVYSIVLNWENLTGGSLGLAGIPKPSFKIPLINYNLKLTTNFSFLIFAFLITFVSYFIIKKITDSPFGKVLEAIRDNELVVKILGKNTFKMKSLALSISAFFAGISGSLYAHYITFINPFSFTLLELILVLTIVIVGGLASLKGTALATVILVLLPETLRFIGFPSSVLGPARELIYSLILILILIYKPKGFFGKIELK
jgi:branched-chain amino acid transport system permease protein